MSLATLTEKFDIYIIYILNIFMHLFYVFQPDYDLNTLDV